MRRRIFGLILLLAIFPACSDSCPLAGCDVCEGEAEIVCESGCVEGERKCNSEKLFQFCEEVEASCWQWSEVKHCGMKMCADGVCHMVCDPECGDQECGYDGCGNECGTCSPEQYCTEQGQCECEPKCDYLECGDDSCGGTCGECAEYEECKFGGCVLKCVSNCEFEGQVACIGNYQSMICQSVEIDPECLQWGDIGTCFEGYVCVGGECVKE